MVSVADDRSIPEGRAVVIESEEQFWGEVGSRPGARVRLVGAIDDRARAEAVAAGVDVVDGPVTLSGRLELRWFLREQAISRTLHRFGNLVGAVDRP